MITTSQLRMNILHKLVDNGWYAVDFVSGETVNWCNANLGPEYRSPRQNGRWLAARMRIDYGWQWFCAFKNAEDLMWYRMNFDCTVVDKSTKTV